jgi:hypothetical protein
MVESKAHPSHNHIEYVRNPNIMLTVASGANIRVGNILDDIVMVEKEEEQFDDAQQS